MPSLHWILVLTVAFLHYLTATPVPTPSAREDIEQKTKTLLSIIDLLMNSTCKEEDSTFYSASNVQPENIGTALTCTMKELATVPKQCFDDNKKIRHCLKASGLIMNILDMSPKTKQEYSACEIHEEKPYKEFLSDLKKLIQQLFSSTG